jgi:hypothetical protein
MLYSDIIKNRYNMKIYLLKIWVLDPSSFDVNECECSAYKTKELTEQGMLKHNFQIAYDNCDAETFEGFEMMDYECYRYEIEELEVI